MHYTITTMTADCGSQILTLDKHGNQYMVNFHDKNTAESTHKTFKTIDEAEKVFLKIASCFIHSYYSAKDRAEMLKNA